MSLLVWLPLTGNINNQGLSGVELTGNNLTYSAGILGNAATFNNSSIVIKNTPIKTGVNDFSFAFWYKTTAPASTQCLYNGRTAVGSAIAIFNLEGKFRFDDGSQKTFNYSIPNNEWHHYSFTRDSANIKLYVDGVLNQTMSAAAFTCTATYATIGMSSVNTASPYANNIIGSLNDYRIYDHVLSAKEVKEISQGLCLHYQLKGTGTNANLISSSTGEFTGTVPSSSYSDFKAWNNIVTVNPGDVYTCSFYAKASKDGVKLNNYFYNNTSGVVQVGKGTASYGISVGGGDGRTVHVLTTQWRKYYVTWNFGTTGTAAAKSFIVGRLEYSQNTANVGETVNIKNVKLEKGNKVTPWCPNSADTLYSALGYNSTTEYDVSNMGQDATVQGTVTTFQSSPRYLTSAYFDGNTSGYKFLNPSLARLIDGTFTMSFWIYSDSEDGNRSVYFGCDSGYYTLNVEKTTGNLLRYYWSGSPDATITGFTIPDGEWVHIAIVRESSTSTKFYKNGVLIYTLTTACNARTSSTSAYYLARDSRTGATSLKGAMSDFRFYSTVLSADDIKALYNNPIGIDKNGGLHCMEVIEG